MKITSGRQANRLLRGLRQHVDMPVVELAERLNIAPQTLHHREAGRSKSLTVDAFAEALDVFGVDIVLIRRDTGRPA
jgi:transcriptional regulator with XRE-family HTH domain